MDDSLKDQENYGIKVAMFIEDPKYIGEITEEEAKEHDATVYSYTYGDDSVGYTLTLHWAVNTQEDKIVFAKYTYEGVPSGLAVNYMLALMFTRKAISDIHTITYQGLERLLRDNPDTQALPSEESYAITFALDAVKLAVKQYSHVPLKDDEKTLVSADSPMSLASIKETIATHNIETLETLANYTKAGLTDKSSHEKLLALIEENKQLLTAQQEADHALLEVPFKDLSPEQRVLAVDRAIDNSIREFLVMDGGDINIMSVKENAEMYEVYISYLGACNGCASSSTGTLFAIENTLKEKLDPQIRVIPI